jgi:hypothetical protein
VYVLNAVALRVGDGTFHAIRQLERLWAVAAVLLLFAIVQSIFTRPWLSAFAGVGFAFVAYGDGLLEHGNVTEEYALVFVLGGILCVVRALRREGPTPMLSMGAGTCFVLAALTKEPFVFSSLAWFAVLFTGTHGRWRTAVARGGFFVVGASLPVVVVLLWLVPSGGFEAWLDRFGGSMTHITALTTRRTFGAGYIAGLREFASLVLQPVWTGVLLFGAGIVATIARPQGLRDQHLLAYACLAAFALEILGAQLSSALYGHYFLQVVPSFILCCAVGGAAVITAIERMLRSRKELASLALLVPLSLDVPTLDAYRQQLARPFERAAIGPAGGFIRTNAVPGDHLWVASLSHSRFYVESGLTPPTAYNHHFRAWIIDTQRSTQAQKEAQLRADLFRNPPAFLIAGSDVATAVSADLMHWLCRDYSLTTIVDEGYRVPAHLYLRRDRANSLRVVAAAIDRQCGGFYQRIGFDEYRAGRFAESLAASHRALSFAPDDVNAYNNVCVAQLQLGDLTRATEACNMALQLDPGNELTHGNLAWIERTRRAASPGRTP